jgi:hypothetical protein
VWTDGQTDLTNLVVVFRNFGNASKKKDTSTFNFRHSWRRISKYKCVNPTVRAVEETKVILNACRGFDKP